MSVAAHAFETSCNACDQKSPVLLELRVFTGDVVWLAMERGEMQWAGFTAVDCFAAVMRVGFGA